MHAIVHAADVQDRDGGALLMASLFGAFPFLIKLYADGGYQGPEFQSAIKRILARLNVEIVKRSGQATGFCRVLPKAARVDLEARRPLPDLEGLALQVMDPVEQRAFRAQLGARPISSVQLRFGLGRRRRLRRWERASPSIPGPSTLASPVN